MTPRSYRRNAALTEAQGCRLHGHGAKLFAILSTARTPSTVGSPLVQPGIAIEVLPAAHNCRNDFELLAHGQVGVNLDEVARDR